MPRRVLCAIGLILLPLNVFGQEVLCNVRTLRDGAMFVLIPLAFGFQGAGRLHAKAQVDLAPVTELVSVNRFGTSSGNGGSGSPVISADGRFVVFGSTASDLVADPTQGVGDLFIRDLQTHTTALVSANRFGTGGGNAGSFGAVISADNRYVAFTSNANDLVAKPNIGEDVFVRDLLTKTTTLVSVNRLGTAGGNSHSQGASISADGRFVTFTSIATDLVAEVVHGFPNYETYVRDLLTGTTTLVSITRTGTGSNNGCGSGKGCPVAAQISADGRFVVFKSYAEDLVDNDHTGLDIFVRDLQARTTALVNVNPSGVSGNDRFTGGIFRISADGRFVVFDSDANDLVANDHDGTIDVFMRDLQTGTTTAVTLNRFATATSGGGASAMTPDGRFVLFGSDADDLVETDLNGTADVFVRDMQTGKTTLVSVNRLGTGSGNDTSRSFGISDDGRFVVFSSAATDLVETPNISNTGIFVRDLLTGVTSLVSVNRFGTDSSQLGNIFATISANGRVVAFHGYADDVVPNDTNGTLDVFVRPVPETHDVTAPAMTVVLSPAELWPANHKLVPVTATITVSDDFDPDPSVTLVSIVSNEPGDGDIQAASLGTDDRAFQLRAERLGNGAGRIYTVTYRVTDASGNSQTVSAQVVVPHDRGKR